MFYIIVIVGFKIYVPLSLIFCCASILQMILYLSIIDKEDIILEILKLRLKKQIFQQK